MAEQARLEVVIDPTGVQSGADSIDKAIQRISSSWVGMSAKVYAAQATFERFWKAASQGAQFEETLDRLNGQTRAYTTTAQNLVQVMQNASNGQLNMANSTQLASRALAMGLSPDTLSTFTQAADLLGDVMGTDLKTSFDTILQGLATGRTQMLANIGVHIDLEKEVKNLAVSTNRTTEQITKQERASIAAKAVMEQLQGQVNKFASDAVSDADKMAAMEAKFQDLTLSAERFAKTMVLFTVDSASKGNSWVMELLQDMGNKIDEVVGKAKSLKALVPDFMLARHETPEGSREQEILGRAIVSDTQGRLARNDFAPKAQKVSTELDPKLQQIQLAGETDRRRSALEAAEKIEQEFATRGSNANREKLEGNYLTTVEFAERQKAIDLEVLRRHSEFIDQRMAVETDAYKQSVRIGFDTTEEKFAAEQKYNTTLAQLQQERALTEEKWHTSAFDGDREITTAQRALHTEEEAWMNEHRALQIQLDQQRREKGLDDEISYYQALKNYREFNFESESSILEADLNLTRATLAKKTKLTEEEAGRLLLAWQNHEVDLANMILDRTALTEAERSTIRLQSLQEAREKELAASNDVAEGWVRGMRRYVKDTQSGFGMAQDMARRTSQMMEQSFQRFFFDAFEGKVQSFKDVLKSMLDFTKQILSQIASQLMTQTILKGLTSGFSPEFGKAGADVTDLGRGVGAFRSGGNDFLVNLPERPGFAIGGITQGPSLAGEAGPEAIVPLPGGRAIPVQWTGGPYAGRDRMVSTAVQVPISVNIINQKSDADVSVSQRTGSNGAQELQILVVQAVNDGINKGQFDRVLGQRYGSQPQPVRR